MSTETTKEATPSTDAAPVQSSLAALGPEAELGPLEIKVDGSVERAIGRLKRAMAREGVLKEVKNRRFYEKPSVKDKRKRREAERRRRRAMRARRRLRR